MWNYKCAEVLGTHKNNPLIAWNYVTVRFDPLGDAEFFTFSQAHDKKSKHHSNIEIQIESRFFFSKLGPNSPATEEDRVKSSLCNIVLFFFSFSKKKTWLYHQMII